MSASENYKQGKASIGKAAELAGVSITEMIDLLSEFGIANRITYDDYLDGMENLRKVW